MKDAGIDNTLLGGAVVLDQFRPEEVNPLAAGSMGHLLLDPAVSAEELAVASYVEVDRPLVAREVVPGSFTRLQVVDGKPNTSRRGVCRSYQMVSPSPLRIRVRRSPCHCASVNLGEPAAIAVNGPDASSLCPGPSLQKLALQRVVHCETPSWTVGILASLSRVR